MWLLVIQEFRDHLSAALSGPFGFRFFVQPLIAVSLGIRDGVTDAHQGVPAYVFDALFRGEPGRRELRQAIHRILVPLVVGVLLDMVVLFYLTGSIRIMTSVVVGTLLVAVPYMVARALSNRITTRRLHKMRE